LGARCAPNGEREGQSPLAYPNWRSSPARRAARGRLAPCTPGPGLRPWEPQFDAWV